MSKKQHRIAVQTLLCLLISFFTCLVFELPISVLNLANKLSSSAYFILDFIRISTKIVLCIVVGVISAKRFDAVIPNVRGSTYNLIKINNLICSTRVLLFLLILGIYYFVPQINWTISNIIGLGRDMYPTFFENIISTIITSFISVSSVAAYVACAISYTLLKWIEFNHIVKGCVK